MNSAPVRLVQEFVRIRQSREQDREAILLSLLSRSVPPPRPCDERKLVECWVLDVMRGGDSLGGASGGRMRFARCCTRVFL